ncbi:hypothetical protein OIU76_012558 [Salix suchowensis]|nr:hypothetical protein OIU76_012558 [Salix suchowensis]
MVLRLLIFYGELGRRDGSRGEEGGVVIGWESEEEITVVGLGKRGCVRTDSVDGDCGEVWCWKSIDVYRAGLWNGNDTATSFERSPQIETTRDYEVLGLQRVTQKNNGGWERAMVKRSKYTF